MLLSGGLGLSVMHGQATLSPHQIHQAEVLGRKTDVPLKLGTLVQAKQGEGFQAFVTTPVQRIAYATSDTTSTAHGSGAKDPFAGELHLNRLRVTGLPYSSKGSGQHNARHIMLCREDEHECLQPAHEVLVANQAVAEFDMPLVTKLFGGGSQTIVVKIATDSGSTEPNIRLVLSSLDKRHL